METVTFDYFNRDQSSQFSFIRIPKAMLTDQDFTDLSLQAKLLYGLLLDRMGEVQHRKWLDEEDRAYVIYPICDIQADLGISRRKAVDCLGELQAIGLVEKKQRGQGKPSILYVKNFVTEAG